jgi:hypothetical protein
VDDRSSSQFEFNVRVICATFILNQRILKQSIRNN